MDFLPPLVGLKPSSEFEESLRIDLPFIELVGDGALHPGRFRQGRNVLIFGCNHRRRLLNASAIQGKQKKQLPYDYLRVVLVGIIKRPTNQGFALENLDHVIENVRQRKI